MLTEPRLHGSASHTQLINNAVINARLMRALPDYARSATRPTTIVMNYEGVTIPGVSKVTTAQAATGAAIQSLLFIRDPLNTCASLLNRKALRHAELVMILRQLFALRNWLYCYRKGQFDGDLIFYNRWLVDRQYRGGIAARLSIKPAEPPEQITSFGGGSSFQDLTRGGETAAPRLLKRWTTYADDRLFRALVTHPYFYNVFLAELSGEIRGSDGESDEDEERSFFLEAARRDRQRHTLVDGIIDGLIENQSAFERIEALSAGPKKRLIIAKAHIGALLFRPRQPPAIPSL